MIKMMILAPRRPAFTHEGFRDYVVNTHGPLVKSITEVAAGIKRYHYNFPIVGTEDTVFGHPHAAEFDIFTQAWFDSLAAHRDNQKHPRYMAVIRPDEEVMADNSRALFHYTTEQEVIAGDRGAFKLFYTRRRKAGLTRAAFQASWLERMTEIIMESEMGASIIARYVQNHALPESDHAADPDGRYYDVIDEFALKAAEDWAQLAEDDVLVARLKAAESDLLAPNSTRSFFSQTVINIAGEND